MFIRKVMLALALLWPVLTEAQPVGNGYTPPAGVPASGGSFTGSLQLNDASTANQGLETLPDFTNWNGSAFPIVPNGNSGAADYYADAPSFTVAGGVYYVFYGGWNSGTTVAKIHMASGPNLANLTKQGAQLSPTGAAWDSAWVDGPRIFYDLASKTYFMYYVGSAVASYEGSPSSIGVATASTPAGPWTKYASNPILAPGSGWESQQLFRPYVLQWLGTYYMFYNASNGTNEQIGFATASSPYGPWTKSASNPVVTMSVSGWDSSHIFDPQVIRFNGQWIMQYSGTPGNGVGYAYTNDINGAPNFTSWVKSTSNPVNISGAPQPLKPEIQRLGTQWLGVLTTPFALGESIWGVSLSGYATQPGNGSIILDGTGSDHAAHRLTVGGVGANATNCVNLAPNTSYSFSIHLHARDITTAGTDYDWWQPNVWLGEDSNAASATGGQGTPVILSRGTVTGASVFLGLDTSLGCLNLTFTPPTSNTDLWYIRAIVSPIVAISANGQSH